MSILNSERSAIIHLLESDLYERVPTSGDKHGSTWESPLGWRVRISGSPAEPHIWIMAPATHGKPETRGELYAELRWTNEWEVHSVLP